MFGAVSLCYLAEIAAIPHLQVSLGTLSCDRANVHSFREAQQRYYRHSSALILGCELRAAENLPWLRICTTYGQLVLPT